MRSISFLFILGLLAAQVAFSQQTLASKSPFQFDVDLARYFGNDTTVYVEFYYGVRENVFSYRADSNRFVGGINMTMTVFRDSSLVLTREWSIPHTLADTSQLRSGKTLVGIESFGVPPGKYRLKVFGYDLLDDSRRDSMVVSFPATTFAAEKPLTSDIELATSAANSTNKESMFYKNTLEVVPNPSRLFGFSVPFLYYYVECYNLLSAAVHGDMKVSATVTDADEKEVIRHDKTKVRTVNSSVEIDKLNISALKGGTYEVRVALLDSAGRALASSKKKFFIYKPGTVDERRTKNVSADILTSEYAVMPEQDLDKEFAQARYIAVNAEQDKYKQLKDVAAKRKFLFEFWRQRETDPDDERGSFKERYKKRVELANQKYSLGIQQGWKTDRGRVTILYGPPDDIERSQNSSESNPYEIWHYNSIQGGVIFVFVDRTGFGEFIQVHSTHRNEIQDNDWFQHYAQKMQ